MGQTAQIPRTRSAPPVHRKASLATRLAYSAAWIACVAASADVILLKSGGRIEGEILENGADGVHIQTAVGLVVLPPDAIESIEDGVGSRDDYQQRAEQAEQTAAAQTELARWCGEVGLRAERDRHLKRALEIDPNHEPARLEAGFIRINGMWVDARAPERAAASRPGSPNAAASRPAPAEDPEKLIAAVQSDWFRRIRAIRDNMLESASERISEDGRRRILEIRDPLAILPMTRALSSGRPISRAVLVSALGQFQQDEATLNLALLALVDDAEDVRRDALVELIRRKDPRVIPQFREALATDSDRLVRRAAIALGALGASEAVPDLIDALTAQRRRVVEVPVYTYVQGYERCFDSAATVSLGGLSSVRVRPVAGVVFNPSGFADTTYERRNVTVFRTEVLEALRTITGQDHGFEVEAWRRWQQEQVP